MSLLCTPEACEHSEESKSESSESDLSESELRSSKSDHEEWSNDVYICFKFD